MFTGIVTGVGRIVEARPLGAGAGFGKALAIEAPPGFLDDVGLGDSIALSGACMTVVRLEPAARRFHVEISAESLDKTAGLNSAGEIMPRSGCRHRSSASQDEILSSSILTTG